MESHENRSVFWLRLRRITKPSLTREPGSGCRGLLLGSGCCCEQAEKANLRPLPRPANQGRVACLLQRRTRVGLPASRRASGESEFASTVPYFPQAPGGDSKRVR